MSNISNDSDIFIDTGIERIREFEESFVKDKQNEVNYLKTILQSFELNHPLDQSNPMDGYGGKDDHEGHEQGEINEAMKRLDDEMIGIVDIVGDLDVQISNLYGHGLISAQDLVDTMLTMDDDLIIDETDDCWNLDCLSNDHLYRLIQSNWEVYIPANTPSKVTKIVPEEPPHNEDWTFDHNDIIEKLNPVEVKQADEEHSKQAEYMMKKASEEAEFELLKLRDHHEKILRKVLVTSEPYCPYDIIIK
jgi:hypothetical protein